MSASDDSTHAPPLRSGPPSITEQRPCETIDGVPLDWSGHGTSHVDYNKSDVLPLTQGEFLGHGMHGGVYETSCNGVKLAWKRKYCRRKIGERERREIEVIKKLSHRHIIRLMGTYTHSPFLGLLLWPVATCDLASLLKTSIGCRSKFVWKDCPSCCWRTGRNKQMNERHGFKHLKSQLRARLR